MKVTLQVSGGLAYFPGLAGPVTIDTCDLSPDEADEIESLVSRSGVWERATETPSPPRPGPARDARSYALEIHDGDRRCRLTFTDPVPKEWSRVVQILRAHQRG